MKIQCIACQHFDLKGNREMASARAGQCTKKPAAGVFYGAMRERECKQYETRPANEVAALVEWARKPPKYQ